MVRAYGKNGGSAVNVAIVLGAVGLPWFLGQLPKCAESPMRPGLCGIKPQTFRCSKGQGGIQAGV